MTPAITNGILLSMLSLFMLVSSHDSRKHEHYTFKDLREAVHGDSLSYEDQQRLFDRLKFWNCTKPKPTSDYRKVSEKIINKDIFHRTKLFLDTCSLHLVTFTLWCLQDANPER